MTCRSRTSGALALLLTLILPACSPLPDEAELEGVSAGRRVFLLESSPPCGTCHTLREAGTRSSIGPDLDELVPERGRVIQVVTEGVAAMPPQRLVLTREQIEAVADYVVAASRIEGGD